MKGISIPTFVLLALVFALAACDRVEGPASTQLSRGDSTVTFEGRAGQIDEAGHQVPIAARARLGGEKPRLLSLSGAGIRERSAFVATVSVYVIASYVDDLRAFRAAGDPMTGLRKTKARVLKLTLLRDVTAEQLRDAFREGLVHNGIAETDPAVAKLLAQFSTDLTEGTEIVLVGTVNADGTESLRVEGPARISVGSRGIATQLWRIWFGSPIDEQMSRLKKRLTGR